MIIKRGDVLYVDLDPVIGSEQNGIRPVVVIQNDKGNKYSPTIIVCPVTSKVKNDIPTHITILSSESGLSKDSTVLVEQIRTIDKARIVKIIGHLSEKTMENIIKAIKISFSIRGDILDFIGNFDRWNLK